MQGEVLYTLVVSFSHLGDYNQAKETQRALSLSNINVSYVDIELNEHGTPSDQGKIDIQLSQSNSQVLHFFGEQGLSVMINSTYLKEQSENFIILQIHQYMEGITQINPNLLIIPKQYQGVTDSSISCDKFYLESMVFEKISSSQLQHIFENSQISSDLNIQDDYIIIMLSGDAPNKQGTMKYFTKQSANNLIVLIKQIIKKKSQQGIKPTLVIQNGPRTGKFDPQSGQIACTHSYKKGQNQTSAIDRISQYFVGEISNIEGIKFKFYNFAFQFDGEKRNVISYYKPLLHVAKQKDNMFLFPLESISMCSELPFYLRNQQLIGYQTSSTNQDHLKFANTHFEKGLFSIFSESQLSIEKPEGNNHQTYNETKELVDQILKKASVMKQK